jgi:hypothetical protein
MSLRSAKYVNNDTEAHVKEPNREHDRNHGNQLTRGLHTSPTHPPGDEAAHAVSSRCRRCNRSEDQRHRLHQIHRRFNQRRMARDSRSCRSNGRKHQSPMHNRQWGRHVHRTSAAHREWVAPSHDRVLHRRSIWLGKDEGLRVQAAQGKAVRATIQAKWIIAWHVQGGRAECMCVKVNLVPGHHFWLLATGAHGIGHKGPNLDFHGNHGNSRREASHNGSDH